MEVLSVSDVVGGLKGAHIYKGKMRSRFSANSPTMMVIVSIIICKKWNNSSKYSSRSNEYYWGDKGKQRTELKRE
jgi:hypothetical protein